MMSKPQTYFIGSSDQGADIEVISKQDYDELMAEAMKLKAALVEAQFIIDSEYCSGTHHHIVCVMPADVLTAFDKWREGK